MNSMFNDKHVLTCQDVKIIYEDKSIYNISSNGQPILPEDRYDIVKYLKSIEGINYMYDQDEDSHIFEDAFGAIIVEPEFLYAYRTNLLSSD